MRFADTRRDGASVPRTDASDAMTETTGDGTRRDRAAGLLHDLRDAVSTVSAAAMLLRASGVGEDQRPYLTAIEVASEKMAALTQLLGEAQGPLEPISPPAPAVPVPVSLHEITSQVRATLAVRCEAVGARRPIRHGGRRARDGQGSTRCGCCAWSTT